MTGPTGRWLASSPLPPLPDGPSARAERLLLLAHYGADWQVWSARTDRYWDAFAERVRAATFTSPELAGWWSELALLLPTAPRTAAERHEVAALLAAGDDRAVLHVLRRHTAALVLRVRIVAEQRRAARTPPTVEEDA